jgi:flagellar biosynthesis/type III secretory pathway protein FliH
MKMMYRRTIKLGKPLAGLSIASSATSDSAPRVPASRNGLSLAPPSHAAPVTSPDSADVQVLRNLLAELGTAVEKLRAQENTMIDAVAQATVELAVALAERVLSAEIAADRQRLDRIVRDALERMQPARAITVRGHADDLDLLQRQIAEHDELRTARTVLTFRADKACERGQLKVEADEWFVEFDTQRSLTELRDRLQEETFANE